MQLIVRSKTSRETISKLGEELPGYIKFVADIEKEILAAGSARHVDDEQLLLKEGSNQRYLWGGGLDLETNELDYDSMINMRPNDNNPSREILSQEIRVKVEKIVRTLLR